MEFLRKYGVGVTLPPIPLIVFGATDFENTPATFVAGDVKISKDGGAFVNTTNLPTHIGVGMYALALTAAEMQAAFISIAIIDQTGPKVWEDDGIIISTYGNASAQHAFDLDSATVDIQEVIGVQKNVALANFPFFMRDSTDHVSGKTGLTITAQRSIDGAAFAAAANSATELSAGWYKINLAASDLNGDTIGLKFTATGADPMAITIKTTS